MNKIKASHHPRGNIMVVEDNKPDLKFLTEILTKAGYSVRAAGEGELALRSVQARLPDLILLDINLPGMPGIELCCRLKDDSKTKDVPVIFISAMDQTDLKVKALEAGGTDYITKPIDPPEVLARINTHLNAYKLQQKLEIQTGKLLSEIEERKKTEMDLKESESKLSILLSNLPGMAYQCKNDKQRTMLFVNEACKKLTGYTPDQIICNKEISYYEIIHPDDRDFVKNRINESLDTSDHFELEYRIISADDEEKWVRERGIQHTLNNNNQRMTDGVIHDITNHKHAEEEKEKLQTQLLQFQKMEAIGTLAGGVAHDFNNLLTVIIGYSDYLLTKLKKEDQMHKYMKEIRKAGQRGASLTNQLLAFSRKQALKPEMLTLNMVVADTKKMLGRLIGEDIEMVTDLEPELRFVKADQGQITQILMNLSINARDAMPEGGKIVIRTENVDIDPEFCRRFPYARTGQFVCLSVEDTGAGMHQKTQSHIFEPFFTTKETGKGTGLGLSVIYGIVKQHAGWINVESEPVQGSVFRVYLPVAFSSELKETAGEKSIEELQGRKGRVLLVEDEKMLRELAVKILSENGYVVFAAERAEEALDLFDREKGQFHIVFSDVVLPGIDGIKLIDSLLVKKPEIKVLLSSGYMDDKSQWPVILERGFNFLKKPYSMIELLKSMKKALA